MHLTCIIKYYTSIKIFIIHNNLCLYSWFVYLVKAQHGSSAEYESAKQLNDRNYSIFADFY